MRGRASPALRVVGKSRRARKRNASPSLPAVPSADTPVSELPCLACRARKRNASPRPAPPSLRCQARICLSSDSLAVPAVLGHSRMRNAAQRLACRARTCRSSDGLVLRSLACDGERSIDGRRRVKPAEGAAHCPVRRAGDLSFEHEGTPTHARAHLGVVTSLANPHLRSHPGHQVRHIGGAELVGVVLHLHHCAPRPVFGPHP
jgi:hypothetical protein